MTLPTTEYIRQAQLLVGTIPFSAATLWRKVKAQTFPTPVKLSPGITAWRGEDVRAWMENQPIQFRIDRPTSKGGGPVIDDALIEKLAAALGAQSYCLPARLPEGNPPAGHWWPVAVPRCRGADMGWQAPGQGLACMHTSYIITSVFHLKL